MGAKPADAYDSRPVNDATRPCVRWVAALALWLLFSSCLVAAEPAVRFEKDVLPIFAARCLSCHGAEKQRGDLDLRTEESTLQGGNSGPAVAWGSLGNGRLWSYIVVDKMPPAPPKVEDAKAAKGKAKAPSHGLTATEKDVIRAWILRGKGNWLPSTATAGTEAKPRGVEATARIIDERIDRKLSEAGLKAAPLADDATFLRRAYLDITGSIPTRAEASTFLDSKDPNKRRALIDRLVASDRFGENLGDLWHNALMPRTNNLALPPDTRPLRKWLAEQIQRDQPWNEIVRALITATGTKEENPAVLFYLINGNADGSVSPTTLTVTGMRAFLGLRMECAQCHDHPSDGWKQEDFWGFAAFFRQTFYRAPPQKSPNEKPPPMLQETPLKNQNPKVAAVPISIGVPDGALHNVGKGMPARFLGNKDPVQGRNDDLPRNLLAQWIGAADNPYLSTATVNRIWGHMFGHGLVNPVDSFRQDSSPFDPALLRLLAQEFMASGYDFRHLARCIGHSEAYQRDSRPFAANQAENPHFGRMRVKVLAPEALLRTMTNAIEVTEDEFLPADPVIQEKRLAMTQVSRYQRFLKLFRDESPEPDPTRYPHGIPQAMALMNQKATNQAGPMLERLCQQYDQPRDVIENLFLAILSRRPNPKEAQRYLEHVRQQPTLLDGYNDVVWILFNRSEFILVP